MSPKVKSALIACVVAVLAAVGGFLGTLAGSDNGTNTHSTTVVQKSGLAPVKTKVDSADHGGAADKTITSLPEDTFNVGESDLKQPGDEPQPANQPLAQGLAPTATFDTVPGCTSRFVRNQSSRNGTTPKWFVLHETVSPNRPGTSDVDGLVNFFNLPSTAASPTFVIDKDGNCAYTVPMAAKPWTQVSANPYSISVEFVNTATTADGSYCGKPAKTAPGCKKLKSVWEFVHKRYPSIGAQAGASSNCVPTRSGIIDHHSLGPCGGGHVDILPWNINSVRKYLLSGSGPASHPTIKAGRKGKWVVHLRRLLYAKGYKVHTKGSFTKGLKKVVVKMQKHWNLDQDGIVGPKSWAVAHKKLNKKRIKAGWVSIQHGH